jgi:hypothetical protein
MKWILTENASTGKGFVLVLVKKRLGGRHYLLR